MSFSVILIGLLFGSMVFLLGWGQIFWMYLAMRSLVVTIGVIITFKASQFALNTYVIDKNQKGAEFAEASTNGLESEEEPESIDMESAEDQMEEEADAEELADAVSTTMDE